MKKPQSIALSWVGIGTYKNMFDGSQCFNEYSHSVPSIPGKQEEVNFEKQLKTLESLERQAHGAY